jgi:hypothetical protein
MQKESGSMNRATVAVEKSMMGKLADHISECSVPAGFAIQGTSELDEWFLRCYRSLHFTACRILGSQQRATLAVKNCCLTASRNPPTFDREGDFRSWLLRILIEETLAILHPQTPQSNGPQ